MRYGAVILAAGIPEKMKQPKPLLCIDGVTMIKRIAMELKRAGVGSIVVVTGYKAESIKRSLEGCDLEFVLNRRYSSGGMLDSLKLGLQAVRKPCSKIIVTPADVPLVRMDTIRALLKGEAMVWALGRISKFI